LVLFVWAIRWEYPPPGSFGAQLDRILRGSCFNFVSWEAEALLSKLDQELASPQNYLDDGARKQVVLRYFELVDRVHHTESEIARVYADPGVTDPEDAAAALRVSLGALQSEQVSLQGTAEAIIEEQIASVLRQEGFAVLGQVLPPVRFHFTPLPRVHIISPRSEIRVIHSLTLRGDIPLDRSEELENSVGEMLDVSSLIVPIGGMAVYPAMVIQTSALSRSIEVVAHEWVHHYLFFWLKPVGLYYDARPDVRTINETAADLAGQALWDKVLARYYLELLPTPQPSSDPEVPPPSTPDPSAFDFIAEMRETRVTVDALLAEGQVEEAETYMELRCHIFVENGYLVRKLNQAYFAFHGAYAAEPGGGAAGLNPVGNPVQELWAASPSIKFFLDSIAPITSREMLLALLEEIGVEYLAPRSDRN
jgi:hypothetical protein